MMECFRQYQQPATAVFNLSKYAGNVTGAVPDCQALYLQRVFTTDPTQSCSDNDQNSATKPRLKCGQKCHFAAGKRKLHTKRSNLAVYYCPLWIILDQGFA